MHASGLARFGAAEDKARVRRRGGKGPLAGGGSVPNAVSVAFGGPPQAPSSAAPPPLLCLQAASGTHLGASAPAWRSVVPRHRGAGAAGRRRHRCGDVRRRTSPPRPAVLQGCVGTGGRRLPLAGALPCTLGPAHKPKQEAWRRAGRALPPPPAVHHCRRTACIRARRTSSTAVAAHAAARQQRGGEGGLLGAGWMRARARMQLPAAPIPPLYRRVVHGGANCVGSAQSN